MTKQATRRGTTVALVVSALTIASPARAQEPPIVREAPIVEDTRQLLLAAYPELREGRVNWRVTSTATGVVVEAHRVEVPFVPVATDAPALVSGTVVVDDQGHLQSLQAGGTLLDAARQKVASLAELRQGDPNATLKAVHAQFAPDEGDKTATLVPAGVRRVLGAETVRSHTFQSDPPPDRLADGLTWRVEIEKQDSAANAFTLVLEPIEGRLMSVVRR